MTCTAWRQVAENLTETLQRGMRVIVQGRLRQRSYQTDDGNKRTVYEVQVNDVGPSLRHATAKVTKAWRSTGETNGGFGRPAGQSPNDSGAGRWVDTTAMDSWRRQHEPVGASEPPF